MSVTRMNRWFLVFLYLLAFILLWEWLIPIMELTNTGQLPLFLCFIILSFIFSLFRVKWWLSVPLKIIYIFLVVHFIYLEVILPSWGTTGVLVSDFMLNFTVLATGDWESMTNPFRTTLFFVLLWMTTYLIRHWIEMKKSILLFYIMTILFIAFIDTFTAYSAGSAIFRIMVIGFLLLGLLFISRLTDRYNAKFSLRTFLTILIPLLFTVVVGGILVSILPEYDPIWPDPIPYFQSVVEETEEKASGGGIAKSGYDPDDSKLGGPFVEDDTLVFEAAVDKKQYWKIETKNTYTSKGWEQPLQEGNQTVYFPGMTMGEFNTNENIGINESKIAQINMMEKYPFLMYPYGMTKVNTNQDVNFHHLIDNGQYQLKYGENEYALGSYEIEYIEHNFSLKALRGITMDSLSSLDEEFSEYLQLPEELPERVADLAETITASSNSVYDKTKAIERYFGRSGFKYARENVAIPGEGDDYVDQFLFDTKLGYCDNFSSSMVVMLRTVGIPARWVKGFAPGEAVQNADNQRVYHITNNEAHSWVEAYMPGIGWMPFEPTIGFDTPTNIDYDMNLEANDPEIQEMPEQERLKREKQNEVVKPKSGFSFNEIFGTVGSVFRNYLWWGLLVTAGLLIIGLGLYKVRRKWLPAVLVYKYRDGVGDWGTYAKMYKTLLRQLDQSGLKRKEGETLSNYAVQVDAYFGGGAMGKLTSAYEAGVYGSDEKSHDWQRLQAMWEDLIKRTSD